MCELSAYVAFNKATHGQTSVKHEKEKKNLAECHRCRRIAVEKLPPSQKSSLEIQGGGSFSSAIFNSDIH